MENVRFVVIPGGVVEGVYPTPACDARDVTRIYLPREAAAHRSQLAYHAFENLQEFAVHPDNRWYQTYDGALYSNSGVLVMVPLGKETLRLAPFITGIYHKAFWQHTKLTTIEVPEGNDLFVVHNGCLMSRDLREVYFVTDPQRVLFLAGQTRWISEDVLEQPLSAVVIAAENSSFCYENGVLTEDGRMVGLIERQRVCIPREVTRFTRRMRRLLLECEAFFVAEGHPVFAPGENVLLDQRTGKVLLVGRNARSLTVPDGYTLERRCLADAVQLEAVSVPAALYAAQTAFEGGKRRDYEVTLRLAGGKTLTAKGDLRRILHIVRTGDVEVKRGTESVYLAMYLAGMLEDPLQKRSFAVSAYGLLLGLMDADDRKGLQQVLADGRLITPKNRARLLRYAQQHHKDHLATLLQATDPV